MSTIAKSWAFQQNVGRSKVVLLILADWADEKHSCTPSQQSISFMTGLSPRSVRRHLDHLRDGGWLRWEPQSWRTGEQAPNRYFLLVDRESDWTPFVVPPSDEDQIAVLPANWKMLARASQGPVVTTPETQLVGQNDHPLIVGENGHESPTMSDVPGLSGWSDWPTSRSFSADSDFSLLGLRPKSTNRAERPVRPALSKRPRRESRRARRDRELQEAAEFDPVKIAEAKIGESLASGNGDLSDDGVASDLSQKPEPRREPGPDTLAGLIRYWNSKMELVEWGSGLAGTDVKKLTQAFSRYRKNGVTPEQLRAMIDRYAMDPGMRTAGKLPWVDFLSKRELLFQRVNKTQKARQAEEHRYDADYWSMTGATA